MKKLFVIAIFLCTSPAFAEGIPAGVTVQQNLFQPEATRPLYNIERNNYTNSAIQKMTIPQNEPEEQEQIQQKTEEKGLKGLFEGFTVEW